KIIHSVVLDHPVYTPAAVAAQKRRHEVSGRNRTFYCGAYWRYGFHEEGVVKSCLYTGTVQHRRHEPVSNEFRYRLFMMYLDLAELPQVFEPYLFWSA